MQFTEDTPAVRFTRQKDGGTGETRRAIVPTSTRHGYPTCSRFKAVLSSCSRSLGVVLPRYTPRRGEMELRSSPAPLAGSAMASRRSLSDREIKRLRALFHKLSERNRCYIEVALQTGYRVSELLSLQVGDVWDHEAGLVRSQVTVERRHMKGGKGAKKRSTCARTVELNDRAQLAITRFIEHRTQQHGGKPPPPDAPLFPSRVHGKPLARWAANQIVHQAVVKAGVKDQRRIGTHTLRKSFARRVYHELRGDILATAAVMGHRYVTTTQRYLEANTSRVAYALRRLGRVRGWEGRAA